MKLAFSTNAFKRFDLFTAIDSIASVGYQGVEIMCDIPHAYPPETDASRRKEIRRKVAQSGMQISNLNAFMLYALKDTWHPSFIERDERLRQQRIDHTIHCVDLAADLGVAHISIEPGGPLDGVTQDWAVQTYLEAVNEIGRYAEQKGVSILIEPEPELLIENPRQFVSFMEKVTSESVGLNFDIGHFYCVGEDPAHLVPLMVPYTRHYHLEDIASTRVHNHLVPGEGSIPLYDVMSAIANTNYTGFITVELYPYEESPLPAARKALNYIRPILDDVLGIGTDR